MDVYVDKSKSPSSNDKLSLRGVYKWKTDRADITLNESRRVIIVQQNWQYEWFNAPYFEPWVYSEKYAFHAAVRELIQKNWGGHFIVRANGPSPFATKHASDRFTIEFDIQWVNSNPHWNVNVRKIPNLTSNVNWASREINIDTEGIKLTNKGGGNFQYPVVHEFGHAVGDTIYANPLAPGDEYGKYSKFLADKKSVMNIGNELRARHIDYLILELNKMIPNTTFSIFRVI